MDLVKIAAGAAAECVRQQADSILDLQHLLTAYDYALNFRDSGNKMVVGAFEFVGAFVEPEKNAGGFRRGPVTFRNGGSSAHASEIPRLMEQLCENIAFYSPCNQKMVDALTKEFLWIHPFADGNGRVGWILYNYLKGTLDSPLALPYYGW